MSRPAAALLLLCCLVPAFGCGREDAPVPVEEGEAGQAWREMVVREEAFRALGPALLEFGRSVMNLSLPDGPARGRFAAAVQANDLRAPGEAHAITGALSARSVALVPGDAPVAGNRLSLWEPVLEAFRYFDHAAFKLESGAFEDAARRNLMTRIRFSAAGRLAGGEQASFKARLDIGWERAADRPTDDPDGWRVTSWRVLDAKLFEAPRPMFREVLDAALPPAERARARESKHARMAARRLADPEGFEPPHPHFFVGSQDRHPGVSVVDVDGDGLDDVYVMARFGKNQLFVNQGDGTFRERAAAFGLDLEDHAAAALFADFDNDGDPDVFIGRTLAPSVYLENRDGRFVDRSAGFLEGGALPMLVSSLAAADVDGDGLLDLYVSTYAAQLLVAELVAKDKARRELGLPQPMQLLEAFLPEADATALMAATRKAGAHEFMSLPGPPNVLLRNRGQGRFEAVAAGPEGSFRNTYQATFGDPDLDGDADLYLAHDFSPNQFLRNDGSGRFVDATEETGTADVGFGMGASWGDFDRDGREDLYISNMYSKAGKRITAGFTGADPRLRKMARGNTLFRNTADGFETVSGTEPPALAVEDAGWSWGSQFLDADNDGYLDLYALSGYYTAPSDVESWVDT